MKTYSDPMPRRLPDLRHLDCPANNIWSYFRWSRDKLDSESCQCEGCGTWQTAETAWKQVREDTQTESD